MTAVGAYLERMSSCAQAMDRTFAPISEPDRELRLHESDAELVERGFRSGLLRIESPNRVRTADPFQGTAWLIEGVPARLCWEYVPHLAAYVELVQNRNYPAESVRFETPDSELNLDLAVLSSAGDVLVLGEVKREERQIVALERQIQEFEGDPGKPAARSGVGAPGGPLREAWKLAHQLWETRAPHLWLVAAGARRVFQVEYGERLTLHAEDELPAARVLWPDGLSGSTPRIKLSRA